MPTFRTGVVEAVLESRAGLQLLGVRIGDSVRRAVLFERFAPRASVGDRVLLNTTAVDLGLGSGGADFVVWNLARDTYDAPGGGHIMKLRYTPSQVDVLAVEAPESPHHDAIASADALEGMPVVAASLHSQLLPVVATIRASRPEARIAYVMTDGGALEASLSRTAGRLRELGWLVSVVTAGNAVGGDLEAVNVYSALLAARAVSRADVAIAGMGPGVVGTETTFGTTALEMGLSLNAAGSLGGSPIACVRMSSGDARGRHQGASHHTLTALARVALVPADVPVPLGTRDAVATVAATHRVIEVDTSAVGAVLAEASAQGLEASHMGRGPAEDPLFFEAAGAAGIHAAAGLGPSGAG